MRFACTALLLVWLGYGQACWGAKSTFSTPPSFGGVNWSVGQGDVVGQSNFAVLSTSNNDARQRSYGLATGSYSASQPTPFIVYLNGNTSSTAQVPVSFTVSEEGQAGVSFDTASFTGNVFGFDGVGNATSPSIIDPTNAVLSYRIDANALQALPAGLYSGSFDFCAVRGGGRARKCNNPPTNNGALGDIATVNLAINILPKVVLKRLDDFALSGYVPTQTGAVASEAFCLGSNNTAGIKISFSSAHANGGNFQLKSTGLANPAFIPYQLIFDRGESSTPAEVVSGAETVLAGNDLSCATDTQSLTASASATAIDAVSADAYQDTITITVAPQ